MAKGNSTEYLINTLKKLTKNTDMDRRSIIEDTPDKILSALEILDDLSNMAENIGEYEIEFFIQVFNKAIFNIVKIFPRRDRNWKNILSELKESAANTERIKEDLKSFLHEEKYMLESLYDEIWLYTDEWSKVDKYLKSIGVRILPKDSKLSNLCAKLGFNSNCNCWYITNAKTKNIYEMNKANCEGLHKTEKILTHGSPGKNWISIICQGMQHGITGTCQDSGTPGYFGYGLYFGNDNSTAYFFNNDNMKGYKSLNLVRIGVPDKWKYMEEKNGINSTQITKEYLNSKGFDSVMGTAPKLNSNEMRDEVCIYDSAQTTIYALVEVNHYMLDLLGEGQ